MTDLRKLRRLQEMADLKAERSAMELQAAAARFRAVSDAFKNISQPEKPVTSGYDQFAATGSAARWNSWKKQERQRLGLLTAKARLAFDAAGRAHAKQEARRRVVEKIVAHKAPQGGKS